MASKSCREIEALRRRKHLHQLHLLGSCWHAYHRGRNGNRQTRLRRPLSQLCRLRLSPPLKCPRSASSHSKLIAATHVNFSHILVLGKFDMPRERSHMETSPHRSPTYIPSPELRAAFQRLKRPRSDEDWRLYFACCQVRKHLQRLWANREREIEDWRNKHEYVDRSRGSRVNSSLG